MNRPGAFGIISERQRQGNKTQHRHVHVHLTIIRHHGVVQSRAIALVATIEASANGGTQDTTLVALAILLQAHRLPAPTTHTMRCLLNHVFINRDGGIHLDFRNKGGWITNQQFFNRTFTGRVVETGVFTLDASTMLVANGVHGEALAISM